MLLSDVYRQQEWHVFQITIGSDGDLHLNSSRENLYAIQRSYLTQFKEGRMLLKSNQFVTCFQFNRF